MLVSSNTCIKFSKVKSIYFLFCLFAFLSFELFFSRVNWHLRYVFSFLMVIILTVHRTTTSWTTSNLSHFFFCQSFSYLSISLHVKDCLLKLMRRLLAYSLPTWLLSDIHLLSRIKFISSFKLIKVVRSHIRKNYSLRWTSSS